MTVIPAYGRDYKSAAAAIFDWMGGKDFQISDMSVPGSNGRYVSAREYTGKVRIRYNKLRSVTELPPRNTVQEG